MQFSRSSVHLQQLSKENHPLCEQKNNWLRGMNSLCSQGLVKLSENIQVALNFYGIEDQSPTIIAYYLSLFK
ncbi:hypothetical protein CDL12_28775 [Handroanthus impetiginosus]|uniref:Uncharacterized protein n=1 Tax=Handroanthus impetiginosus TaxID=429701 RepID=A0A2G9G0N1_9LAMI|nr:hypothetical protein CDL12_28775 [Handroanthus impetiginosus]